MFFLGSNAFNKPSSKMRTTKSKFSTDDDNKLRRLVSQYGTQSWTLIASKFKDRNSRQCRERWNNYLSPKNDNSKWTYNEDIQLLTLFSMFGNQWAKLAHYLPNRSPVNIRNRFRQLFRFKCLCFHREQKLLELQRESHNQMICSSDPLTKIQDDQIDNYNYSPNQYNQFSDFLPNENNIEITQNDNSQNVHDPKQPKILLPPCKDLPFNPRSYVK